MVQNPQILRRFEDEENRALPPDLGRNLRLLDAMYRHARAMGVWNGSPGIQPFKLRLARALNV